MFKSADLVFLDFETASSLDLKGAGATRYAADTSTHAIILAFAIGDAPAQVWHADGAILDWNDAPDDLRAAFDGGATFAAWNASFDSSIWNYATLGFPFMAPERVIDPMIQAGVSNLPTDLESASRALGGEGKQKDGKKLIRLFCVEGAAPCEHPEEWQLFLRYARRDVGEMRDGYRKTRPLPRGEWEQYWAFERINRRGVALDMPFVRRAAALAVEDAASSGCRLDELTDGTVTRVTQAKRIAAWLHDQLADAAMREVLTVGVPGDDDGDDNGDDDEAEPQEFSLTRDRVARVLAMLEAKRANGGLDPAETKAREAATLRLYGAGSSPKKFARLEAQQVDGVLRGQYRFAGAGQTGRLSSKGAQIHNLTRDVLGEDGGAEAPLVDAIAEGCSYAALAAADPVDVPVARKLALLVRPALIAGPGKVFVWSDWSADRGANYALARRVGRRREGPRYLPRQRSRPRAAGYLHTRRRRHPAQEDGRDNETGTRDREGRLLEPRLRGIGRRAQEHGAELPHPPRRRRGASHCRCLARGKSLGAGVLGRPPRRRKRRPVGRGDASVGAAWADHHRGPHRLHVP